MLGVFVHTRNPYVDTTHFHHCIGVKPDFVRNDRAYRPEPAKLQLWFVG